MPTLKLWIPLGLLLSVPSLCLGGGNLTDDVLITISNEIQSLTQYPDNVDLIVKSADGTIFYEKSIGVAAIPQWITKTAFGHDRYYLELSTFCCGGSIGELDFSQTTVHPFVQLLWFPNLDRKHDMFQQFTTVNIVNSRTARQIAHRKLEVGSCLMEYVGTEINDTANPTMTQLHFIVYKNKTGNFLVLDESTKKLSKISLTNSPSNVFVGAIILGGPQGFQMDTALADNITSLLGTSVCAEMPDLTCCDDGTPGTNSDGQSICTCNGNKFGACCDKECVNGRIVRLPPHGSQICKCEYGYGGPECNSGNGSPAAHFITKMDYEATHCQNKVSQHWPYTYSTNNLLIDSMSIADEANKVEIAVGAASPTLIQYGSSNMLSSHSYYSSQRNDFLLAVDVPFGQTLSSDIKIFVRNDLDTALDEASTLQGMINVRSCDVHYYIVHRNGTTGSLAEIFFVVGITGHSTYDPSQAVISDTSTTSTLISTLDTFTTKGDKEGLLIGYTFIASYASSIPEDELRDVVSCYSDPACDSLTEGCAHGTAVVVNGTVSCVCNEGFLGPNCNYPC